MTSNNLREHLTWFLGSPPSVPLPNYVSTVEDISCGVVIYQTNQADPIVTGLAVDDFSLSTRPEAAQELSTECADNDNLHQSTDVMARLQLPPSTTKKPRMLSQVKTAQSGTPKLLPTPATTGSSGCGSPTNKYSTSRPPLVSNHHGHAQAETKSSDKLCVGDIFDRYASVLDIDEIDLTEKVGEQTSSSATVETFGEPERIWREDSASRAEPVPKKGKKRTSGEYEADLLLRSPRRIPGKRAKPEYSTSGTSRKIFGDSKSPTNRSAIGPGAHIGRESLAQSEKGPRLSSDKFSIHQSLDEQRKNPETETSTVTQQSPSSLGTTLGRPTLQQHRMDPESEGMAINGKPALIPPASEPRARPRRGIVEDSEEDDIKEVENEAENRSSSARRRKTAQERGSPVVVQSSPPMRSESQITKSKPSILQNVSPRRRPKHEPTPSLEGLPAVSTTLPPVIPAQPYFPASSLSQNASSNLPSEIPSELAQRFLNMPRSSIDRLASQLQLEKKRLHEIKVAQIMDEKGVSVEVEQQVRATKKSQKSLEDLGNLQSSHRTKSTRLDEIKKMLLDLMEADLEDEESEQIKRLRDEVLGLKQELKKVEKDILHCLDVADIWHRLCSDGADGEIEIAPSIVNADLHPNKVLIASTQMHWSAPGTSAQQDSTRRKLQSPAKNDCELQDLSVQKENIQPGYKNSTMRKLEEAGMSAGRSQKSPYQFTARNASTLSPPAQKQSLHHSPAKRNEVPQTTTNGDDFPFEDFDDNASFHRRMRSPSMPFSALEAFDQEGDEDDLLGAAEQAEQTHPMQRAAPIRQDVGRSALQEVNGNAQKKLTPRASSQTGTQIPQLQYPWSKAVKSALRDRFHLHGFRHNQLEAINATLSGKDAFVLMPTGGGKSLCYQLPAVVQSGRTQGVTVVISPLLSLMQDQVDALQKKGIQAFLINSEVTSDHRKFVLQTLRGPEVETYIQILYVTPEMITKSENLINAFHLLHRHGKLARLVIDEAHCVSQWGHDFRPDYKALGDVRRQFSGVPAIALTATATENVKVDVIHNLGMDGCEVFTQSFNRPNLTYEIKRKGKAQDAVEDIANTINTRHRGKSGIVYCFSRESCEKIAEQLRQKYKVKAEHYHAKMEAQDKHKVQKRWQAGDCNVIVATIAFGMGIDKPDVRFVIHHTIPKSLEGYYQETGRAGRDGKRSSCYLYYGYSDTNSIQRMIEKSDGSWEQQERQKQMLRNVVQFCENKSDCRRVQVLAYFNEHFDREKCNAGCDNCNSGSIFESRDFTDYAESAINLVRRVQGQHVTLLHCVDVFRGRKSKKITELGHDEIDEHGAGSGLDRGDAERLFHRLVSENALMEFNRVNKRGFAIQYIRLGLNAGDFSSGRRRINIQIRISPDGKSQERNKGVAKRKKSGTGVGAADDGHYPASTNVSSPLQAATKRRLVRKADLPQLTEDSSEGDNALPSFEPIRERGVSSRRTERQLGPPITSDPKISRLNAAHRHILDDFMENAKKECSSIMLDKGLRSQPFSNGVLREMAINFPLSKTALLAIDGIDHDKVDRYGPRFLKLVQEAHNTYEALMRAQEDVPDDPNHRNVVEISDDEQGIGAESEDSDDHEFSDDETSQYFQQTPEVAAFNAQMSRIPMLPSAGTKRQLSANPSIPKQRGGSRTFRAGRGGRKGDGNSGVRSRDKSGASSTKKQKKKGSGYRTSNGSSNSGSLFPTRKGGIAGRNRRGNGNERSIGLMPT